MGERISRLMDGDVDGSDAEAAFRELKSSEAMAAWECYHVIGDTLRRSGAPTPGFAQRFAVRLAAEPTVLAPRQHHAPRLPLVWAAAATVAAVTVVGWVAVRSLDPQATAVAKAREAAVAVAAKARPQLSPDYLLAHQEFSPTAQIPGIASNLRPVAAGAAAGRP